MVTGWLVGLGQALGGSGASRSRVGGAFGESESLGRRRRRSRWGPFEPFGRRARSARVRVTERLGWVNEALGASGTSRSRVRGSVGAVAEGPGGDGGDGGSPRGRAHLHPPDRPSRPLPPSGPPSGPPSAPWSRCPRTFHAIMFSRAPPRSPHALCMMLPYPVCA